jgi:hypothetical protein
VNKRTEEEGAKRPKSGAEPKQRGAKQSAVAPLGGLPARKRRADSSFHLRFVSRPTAEQPRLGLQGNIPGEQ